MWAKKVFNSSNSPVQFPVRKSKIVIRQLATLLETFWQNNGQPIVAILDLTKGSKISSIYHNSVTTQSIIVKLAVYLHKWLAKKKL
jgi:hypothetical protein